MMSNRDGRVLIRKIRTRSGTGRKRYYDHSLPVPGHFTDRRTLS